MDILDDMGVSKLSAKVFFLKWTTTLRTLLYICHSRQCNPRIWGREIITDKKIYQIKGLFYPNLARTHWKKVPIPTFLQISKNVEVTAVSCWNEH